MNEGHRCHQSPFFHLEGDSMPSRLSWPGQFLLGSVSSNLYLEHLRILLNWSTPLPYCLVRTGIPIPKATDSDSVIKPEPSEESMSL